MGANGIKWQLPDIVSHTLRQRTTRVDFLTQWSSWSCGWNIPHAQNGRYFTVDKILQTKGTSIEAWGEKGSWDLVGSWVAVRRSWASYGQALSWPRGWRLLTKTRGHFEVFRVTDSGCGRRILQSLEAYKYLIGTIERRHVFRVRWDGGRTSKTGKMATTLRMIWEGTMKARDEEEPGLL